MNATTYFTPKKIKKEIPFTLINPNEFDLFLFGVFNNQEYKFELVVNNNLINLKEETNPFEEDDNLVNEKITLLYSEFIESNSTGYQSSEAARESYQKPGYGPDDIFVENKPFSLRHIIDLIDNKDIEMSPDFQRNFIWDKTRQSRLIESVLLGLPLPSVYLSQYDDGLLTVVDGLQRLNTIHKFYKNELRLVNLEYLTECNDKTYNELDTVLTPLRIRKFSQTQIMCFVIDYRSPSKLKFDLFRRLNTGGKPLNNQEIRNCLSNGRVQRIIKSMIELPNFKLATDGSIKDKRMDGRDAALRFICFYDLYKKSLNEGNAFKDYYNGDMEGTLDSFIDTLNKKNEQELSLYINHYNESMKKAFVLFGRYSFRKMTNEHILDNRRPPINKLLMLVLSVLLAIYDKPIYDKDKPIYEKNSIRNKLINHLQDDYDLMQVLSWGTNGKYNVEYAFKSLEAFLNENL